MQGCASAIPLRYALFGLKSSHILPGAQGEIKTQLYRAAAQQLYPFVLSRSDLETVISIHSAQIDLQTHVFAAGN